MTQPPNLTATKNICKCGHDIMAHTYMDIKPECVDCVCNMFEPQQPPLTAEEYTLMLCDRCNQMTNHVCHKCNKFIPLSLITDRIKKVEEEYDKIKDKETKGVSIFIICKTRNIQSSPLRTQDISRCKMMLNSRDSRLVECFEKDNEYRKRSGVVCRKVEVLLSRNSTLEHNRFDSHSRLFKLNGEAVLSELKTLAGVK